MAKAKKRTVNVDFTDVQSGGGRFRVPEGDYLFTVDTIETGTIKNGDNAGSSKLVVTLKGVKGRVKGRKVYDHIGLHKKTLWKLRSLLEATGQDIPEAKGAVDIDALIGQEVGVTLGDDEYENKISSKPQGGYLPPESVGEEPEVDDDEEDDEDVEVEDDEEHGHDLSDMDRKELLAFNKTLSNPVTGTKDLSDKKLRKAIEKVVADDGDELEEIDDDEL